MSCLLYNSIAFLMTGICNGREMLQPKRPKERDNAAYSPDGNLGQGANDPMAYIEQLDQLLVRAAKGNADAYNRTVTRPTRDLAIAALEGMCQGVSSGGLAVACT